MVCPLGTSVQHARRICFPAISLTNFSVSMASGPVAALLGDTEFYRAPRGFLHTELVALFLAPKSIQLWDRVWKSAVKKPSCALHSALGGGSPSWQSPPSCWDPVWVLRAWVLMSHDLFIPRVLVYILHVVSIPFIAGNSSCVSDSVLFVFPTYVYMYIYHHFIPII